MANDPRFASFSLDKSKYSEELDYESNKIEPLLDHEDDYKKAPSLRNGLDICLQQPGVVLTETINDRMKGKLGSYFTQLPQYSQINETAISPYYRPGVDPKLRKLAIEHKSRFIMSTSSISPILSHIFFAMSNFKSPHFANLSEPFDHEPLKFMVSQRKPNTVFLNMLDKEQGLYSVDGDAGFQEEENIVLLKMGKYMESMCCFDHEFFKDHFILDLETNQPRKPLTQTPEQLWQGDYFRYAKVGRSLMRSQIDCGGVTPEGKKVVFEIKTRATCVLRYDVGSYINHLDYHITRFKG